MKLFTVVRVALFTIALGLLALPAASQSVSLEPNTNRRGNDYSNFPLAAANPELCRQACARDNRCAAFTYVGGQAPHCWLKNVAPPASGDGCCVSGVKGSGAGLTAGMEMDMNRRGGDYANFDLSVADPNQCKIACQGDQRCVAYTYVKPGVQGPGARCWLKGSQTTAFADACCISGTTTNPGIVAGGGGGDGRRDPIPVDPNNPLSVVVQADKNVLVKWTNIPGMQSGDIVQVVKAGAPEGVFHPNWAYTNSYSGPFQQMMRERLAPGDYEARIVNGRGVYARVRFRID